MRAKPDKLFTKEAVTAISGEIKQNDGNEVFFLGTVEKKDGIVSKIEPLAWGNESAVPAMISSLQSGQVVIHNHPSGALSPSEADIQIASLVGNQGVGFYIVNNNCTQVKVVVQRYFRQELLKLDSLKIADMLGTESEIAQKLEGYEARDPQIKMTYEVTECFNQGNIGVFEAGTGTGKTLAYLIPAIEWAMLNKERVVISTKTINLQEQLIQKDIPFLKKAYHKNFKAVLVKGRRNYVCLRKVDSEEQDLGLFKEDEDFSELAGLIKWAKKTEDGSTTDLNFVPKPNIWDKINCESDTCTGLKCPFYEDCFLVNARREAATANLIIVNHHLLFADVALRGSFGSLSDIAVLPPYTRVILDEAHHVEGVSTQHFGKQVTQLGVKRLLNRLVTLNKKGMKRGILPKLMKKISNVPPKQFEKTWKEVYLRIDQELINKKFELLNYIDSVFDEIHNFVKNNADKFADSNQMMITEKFFENPEWQRIINDQVGGWINKTRNFVIDLNNILDEVTDAKPKNNTEFDSVILEMKSVSARLSGLTDAMNYLCYENDAEVVKWIELTEKYGSVKIIAAPIDVGDYLKNSLFDVYETVVMTSATLAVDDKFDYMTTRLGLDRIEQYRLTTQIFQSPFNYPSQVLIGIPTDITVPDSPTYSASSSKVIIKSLQISEGRSFVLFTSFQSLNDSFHRVKAGLNSHNFDLMKQGMDTRTNLLNRFKNTQLPVLFAADSFWEGVDVVGENLSSIIISRLPFRVPTAPIEIARRKAVEQDGGNSFYDYTVPQAIIKFKQGFGRLIRHKSDTGTILILDNRIVSKSYGRVFLNSLPKCSQIIGTQDEIMEEFKEFYESR